MKYAFQLFGSYRTLASRVMLGRATDNVASNAISTNGKWRQFLNECIHFADIRFGLIFILEIKNHPFRRLICKGSHDLLIIDRLS